VKLQQAAGLNKAIEFKPEDTDNAKITAATRLQGYLPSLWLEEEF
jgi:hypothetical protein